MDMPNCPEDVTAKVHDCLQKGVGTLLPTLHARVKKATKLLSQPGQMKTSQRVNLRLILQSLNDPAVIATLLPPSGGGDQLDSKVLKQSADTVTLMRVLLKQLGQLFASRLESIEEEGTATAAAATADEDPLTADKVGLLYSLHTHFVLTAIKLSGCVQPSLSTSQQLEGYILHIKSLSLDYLKLLFMVCQDLFEHCRLVSKFVSLPYPSSYFTFCEPIISILLFVSGSKVESASPASPVFSTFNQWDLGRGVSNMQ